MPNKVKLRDVISIQSGYQVRPEHWERQSLSEEKTFLLQMKNIYSTGEINEEKLDYLRLGNIPSEHYLKEGDVLFTSRGEHNYGIIIKGLQKRMIAAFHFFVLRVQERSLSPEYLVWYINCKWAQKYFQKNATGSAMKMVNRKVLGELELVLPSTNEQERIVALDRLWKKEKRIMAELMEKREQLLEAACLQKLEHLEEGGHRS